VPEISRLACGAFILSFSFYMINQNDQDKKEPIYLFPSRTPSSYAYACIHARGTPDSLVFLHEPVHEGRQVAIDVCISGLTWPHFSHVLPLFHPSVRHLHGGLGHQINLTNITYSREYLYSIYTQEDICRIDTPSLVHIWVCQNWCQ